MSIFDVMDGMDFTPLGIQELFQGFLYRSRNHCVVIPVKDPNVPQWCEISLHHPRGCDLVSTGIGIDRPCWYLDNTSMAHSPSHGIGLHPCPVHDVRNYLTSTSDGPDGTLTEHDQHSLEIPHQPCNHIPDRCLVCEIEVVVDSHLIGETWI